MRETLLPNLSCCRFPCAQVYDEDYEVDDDEDGEQRWEVVAQHERMGPLWAGDEHEGSEAGPAAASADDALSSRGISREASTVNPNPAPMRMSGSGVGPVQTLSTPSKKGLASLLESSGDSDGDELDGRRRSGASSAAAAAAAAKAAASGLSRSHLSTFGFSEEDEVDLPDGVELPGLEQEQQQQRAAGGDSLFSDGSASLEAADTGAAVSPEHASGSQGQEPSTPYNRLRGPGELVLPEADAAGAGEDLGTAGSTASTRAGASTGRSEPTVSPGGTVRTTHDRSHFRRRAVAPTTVELSSPPAGVTAENEDDDLELDGLVPPPPHAQRSALSEPADQKHEDNAAAEVPETSTAGPAPLAAFPAAVGPTAATARGMFSYDFSVGGDDAGLPLARRGSLSSSLGDRLPYGAGRGTAAYGGAYDGSMELEDGRYADPADRSAELPSGPLGLGLDADESFGSLGAPPELPGSSRLEDSGPLSRSSGASSAGPGRRSSAGLGERDGASRGPGPAGLPHGDGPAVVGGASRRALEASGSMAASRSIMPEESYGLIAPPEGAGPGLLGSGSDGDEDMFADSADGMALGGMSLEQSRKSVGLYEGRAKAQQGQGQDGGRLEADDEDGDQGLAEQPSGVSVVSSAGAASGPFGKLRNQPSGLLVSATVA